MKLLSATIAFSILLAACNTSTDARDRPLSEVYALDSTAQAAALGSLTEQEKILVLLASEAYGNDSAALHRRTLNQLISEGKALRKNAPMQYSQ